MSTGVVGRQAELASLRGFVSNIPSGAVVVALEGEAGVGKTTLWEAGLEEAGDRGFRVLTARSAAVRRTIDSTPASCSGPMTAMRWFGHVKTKRGSYARPDMP